MVPRSKVTVKLIFTVAVDEYFIVSCHQVMRVAGVRDDSDGEKRHHLHQHQHPMDQVDIIHMKEREREKKKEMLFINDHS